MLLAETKKLDNKQKSVPCIRRGYLRREKSSIRMICWRLCMSRDNIACIHHSQICEKLCIWIKVIVIDIGSEWRQKTEQKQWLKFSLYTHTNSSRYLSFNLFTLIRIYGSAYMHRVCLERIELFNLQCVSAWTFKSTLWRYFRSNKQFAVRFECKEKLQTEYRETLCNHNCCTTEQINR